MKKNMLKTIVIIETILIVVVAAVLLWQLQKNQDTMKSTNTPTTAEITSVPTTAGEKNPSEILDLTNWKITLPIGSDEKPIEVKQPVLATYRLDPWFVATDDGTGVRFRAPVKSVTTSGSNYPRSELREMTRNGTQQASWSTNTGTHTMTIDQAITAVPTTKKHVVAGQIHDAEDDIIVIRLEYPKLYINVDGDNVKTLDENYTLGKRFTIKFVVQNGKTDVYYNNSQTPVYTLTKSYSGAYFKAGAYTQSNCSREQNPSLCNENNYGEVILYDVEVTHQ